MSTMTERLHVIMSVSRPWNVAQIVHSYLAMRHPFELRIHLMVQGPDPDPKGVHKINEAIDSISNGWILTVADDTVQHPDLMQRLWDTVSNDPEAGIVVFGNDRGNGVHFIPSPETMTVGRVCGSAVAYNRHALGDHRFDYEAHAHEADGFLIQDLYQEAPNRFRFVPDVLTTFNSLEWH